MSWGTERTHGVDVGQYWTYSLTGLALIALLAWLVDRQWKKSRRRRAVDGVAFSLTYVLGNPPPTDDPRYPGRAPQLGIRTEFNPVLTDERENAWNLLTAAQVPGDAMVLRHGHDARALSMRGAALARLAFAATPREVRDFEKALRASPRTLPATSRSSPAVTARRSASLARALSPFRPSVLAYGIHEVALNDAGSAFFEALASASGPSLAEAELLADLPIGEGS